MSLYSERKRELIGPKASRFGSLPAVVSTHIPGLTSKALARSWAAPASPSITSLGVAGKPAASAPRLEHSVYPSQGWASADWAMLLAMETREPTAGSSGGGAQAGRRGAARKASTPHRGEETTQGADVGDVVTRAQRA